MTEIRARVDGAAAVADVFFTRAVSPTLPNPVRLTGFFTRVVSPTLPCATDWLLYVAYTTNCEISCSIVIATVVFQMILTKHEKITTL